MDCPFCKSPTSEEAAACAVCSARLVKKCPYCAEEIQILARRCRFCQSDLVEPGPEEIPAIQVLRGSQGVGEDLNIVVEMVLTIVTLGLYSVAMAHRIGSDLNRHAGREVVEPVLHAVLGLVTCGLWYVVTVYKYTTVLNDIERAEGLPGSDIMVLCVVLAVALFGPASLLIIQDHLNRHWRLHAARPHAPA